MPRFEFECDACEKVFTIETKRVEDPCIVPSCPNCGAGRIRLTKFQVDVPQSGRATLTLELRPGVVPITNLPVDWLPLDEAPND